MSAAWPAATLLLIVLGLYYLVTGARTLGQSLFVLLVGVGGLAGQYLYAPVESRHFPSARVTVIRAPSSGLVLAVRPDGEFLAPSTVRPSFSDRDRARGLVPEDGEIIETDFERLRGRP